MSGQNDEWSYWLDIACGKPLLGSSDRDNGSKDVAELKKTEFASFHPLKLSMVRGFSWSWILKDFIQVIKRKENSSLYVHDLDKTSN